MSLVSPVQYITIPHANIAYRTISSQSPTTAPPLVLHIHYRGNLTFWDPLLLRTLSQNRDLILFDQPGTGRSTGTIPSTYQGWADDLIAFVDALGLKQIDLLGFSMGGRAVQMVALTRPELVRKLIIAGADASEPLPLGEGDQSIRWPRGSQNDELVQLVDAKTRSEMEYSICAALFPPGPVGEEAARRYWERVRAAAVENGEEEWLEFLGPEGSAQQFESVKDWLSPNERNSWARLGELRMSVLVANGDDDVVVPTPRSYELMDRIKYAQLVIYPESGHGFLWQYAELFGKHVNMFLDGEAAKL